MPPRAIDSWASELKTPAAEVITGPAVVKSENVIAPEEVIPVMLVRAPALVNRSVPAVCKPPSTKFKDKEPVPELLISKTSAVVVFLIIATGLAPVRVKGIVP